MNTASRDDTPREDAARDTAARHDGDGRSAAAAPAPDGIAVEATAADAAGPRAAREGDTSCGPRRERRFTRAVHGSGGARTVTGVRRAARDYVVLLIVLVALVLVCGWLSDRFLTMATLGSIVNRVPALALLATGMTLVLVVGGIDLSVGSVLALSGAVLGYALVDRQWPVPTAASAAILVGLAAGAINGLIVVGLRVPAFIVTLGMLEMARGLGYLVTQSETRYLGGAIDAIARPLGVVAISPAFLLATLVAVAGHILLTRTVLGRQMIAIGTNEAAARLAGIDPRGVIFTAYAMSGALAGLAALCQTARLGASDPNAGLGMELSAIAAAVIGGTSLSGGRGSVLCSWLGVLIIATLEAGLAQAGVSEPLKRVITGAVIVLAVVIDGLRTRAGAS